MNTIKDEKNNLLDFGKLAEMKQELGTSFRTVLQHFQAGLLTRPEKINQALKDNNPAQLAIESHSLKSVCKQIGLYKMGAIAAELESISNSGNLDKAEAIANELTKTGQLAHHALEKYLNTFNKPRPFFEKGVTSICNE